MSCASWNDQLADDDYEEHISDDDWNDGNIDKEAYFFHGDLLDIQVSACDQKERIENDWLVDHGPFPLPPEMHLDPLPLVRSNDELGNQDLTSEMQVTQISDSYLELGDRSGKDGRSCSDEHSN